MERIELLLKNIEGRKKNTNSLLQILSSESTDYYIQKGCEYLWYEHENYALKNLFLENNISKAKQNFYTCARLDEYATKNYDAKILDYGINHLSYALLSDCKELILKYADLKHCVYEEMIQNGSTTPVYVLQCIIKDDWSEYERVMPIMKNKSVNKWEMELDMLYYKALAEKNLTQCEVILNELLLPKNHNKRNKSYPISSSFVSHPVIGYAKLASLKGVEVEINNELIPKALLRIKPNEIYTNEYSFLN